MTEFTDAKLDGLWFHKKSFTEEELDDALRELATWQNSDPLVCDSYDAITYLRAKLSERDPIGAAIMRELAAEVCKIIDHTQGEPETQFDRGYDQACVENAEIILKIPLPAHAETLAYAMQLPEIKALVDEVRLFNARVISGEVRSTKTFNAFCNALAALEPKP